MDAYDKFLEGLNKQVADYLKRTGIGKLDTKKYDHFDFEFYGNVQKPVSERYWKDLPRKRVERRIDPGCPEGSFWSQEYKICVPKGEDPAAYYKHWKKSFPFTQVHQARKVWPHRSEASELMNLTPNVGRSKCPDGFRWDNRNITCIPEGIGWNDWVHHLRRNKWDVIDWFTYLHSMGYGTNRPLSKEQPDK